MHLASVHANADIALRLHCCIDSKHVSARPFAGVLSSAFCSGIGICPSTKPPSQQASFCPLRGHGETAHQEEAIFLLPGRKEGQDPLSPEEQLDKNACEQQGSDKEVERDAVRQEPRQFPFGSPEMEEELEGFHRCGRGQDGENPH